MSGQPRVILDTNVLVSAAVTPHGTPRRVVDVVLRGGLLLFTDATYAEIAEVLTRPRLQRYLPAGGAEGLLERLAIATTRVPVGERIEACRDPKDDKFLEAAVSGAADYLVTGDEDLLLLHPFRGIPILTPAAFLPEFESGGHEGG